MDIRQTSEPQPSKPYPVIRNKKVLVTGGAGFIGSNICEDLLRFNNQVVCFDNFLTGFRKNIEPFLTNRNFQLIEGDIRNIEDCRRACEGAELVLHQAALGSVPRSINDPLTTNDININGFLNVLIAARDAKIKRFVYAVSSSVYGDLADLPKIEENIGNPLSPYAVTKYANELYAHVFALNYGMEIIGLRYFNVFGKRQDPNGPYAAVIPKFTMLLMAHKSPVINGDGSNSRDFTYIDNILQMNHLAATTQNKEALGQVFNTATGERNDLNQLFNYIKEYLSLYDKDIAKIEPVYGPERQSDIPHSLASIDKAKRLLGYNPQFNLKEGLEIAVKWYYENLKNT